MNSRARSSGSRAAAQRLQNPDTMWVSEAPARPASVSHAGNSAKSFSFISGLYLSPHPGSRFWLRPAGDRPSGAMADVGSQRLTEKGPAVSEFMTFATDPPP